MTAKQPIPGGVCGWKCNMARIITNGRGLNITKQPPTFSTHKRIGWHVRLEDGRKYKLFISKRQAVTAVPDMALVQEHFGVNISGAMRIALHLAADAIRRNKANVELPT